MENRSFDVRTRVFSEWQTRRRLVTIAGAGALVAVLGLALEPDQTEAKRRRVKGEHNIRGNKAIMCISGKTRRVPKKKRKKYLKQGATRGKCSGCTPVCPPGTCGDDGCGGTCGCVNGTVCNGGVCEVCDVSCTSGDSAACGKTLVAAIDGGGTILVCPGEYEGQFALTLDVEIIGAGSGNDPATSTILRGSPKTGATVPVTSAVVARLVSLRITGGNETAQNSGGVYVGNAKAEVTIADCAVVENTGYDGGGVSVYSGSLTVTGSDISYNTATRNGGGIATATLTTVESTTITKNTAAIRGGGIFLSTGTLDLGSGVTITENTANDGAGSGGGVYKDSLDSTINNSATVTNNNPENCAGNDFPYTCP